MTMRLDIVTNDAGELVRREHARELGAGVVVAIYRLAKLAQVHDLQNQAFLRQLEQTHQIIGDYCLRSGSNVNVLFAHKATFVAGQLLKGNRGAYIAAQELGDLFMALGGSELFIQRDITREELNMLAEQISAFYRQGASVQFRSPTPKIRLRPVNDAARLRGIELENLTTDQRIVRAYASAVVIMRRFFEDLQHSRYILPRRIKRIAQSLVDLSDASTAAFLGVTEVRNANFDEAGRAVNTAILAVSIARESTQERATLSQIAMAAMMHDVARPRALALAGASAEPDLPGMAGPTVLSEDQEDRLHAGSAAVLTALGRVNEPSIRRTVLTFESLWIRRQTWLGPVYWGARGSTLHATIIAIARRYNDLLTPEPGLPPPTPDFAVATLSNELTDPQDRTVLRMLVSALNLLPTGTVVQLSTGEVAEVTRGARGLGDKPRVRVVADASGAPYAEPADLELAHDPSRSVHRVLSVDGWKKGLEENPHELAPRPDSDYPRDTAPPPNVPAQPPPAARRASIPPAAALSPLSPNVPAGRSAADRYADQYAAWGDAPADGRGDSTGSSIQTGPSGDHASQNLPSMGSSPSAVAEAMGRMINDSLRPPAMSPREAGRSSHDGASRVAAPGEPTARGNLASTPLPHVLVYMLDHALTGSVVFEGSASDDVIYFVHGVPAKIRLAQPVARLGEVLAQTGGLDPNAIDAAVEGASRLGLLFGEYIVGHDLTSREALAWGLEAQLLQKVANLANLQPEITYSYYRDVDLLDGWGGEIPMTHPLNPILASVRHWDDRARVRATLNRIGRHPLVVHPDSDLSNLAVLREEQTVLEAIGAESMPLPQLFKRELANEEIVSSLVYSLAVTRQFAFKGQKKGPMAARGAAWRSVSAASAPAPSPHPQSPPNVSHTASGPILAPQHAMSSSPSVSSSGSRPVTRGGTPPPAFAPAMAGNAPHDPRTEPPGPLPNASSMPRQAPTGPAPSLRASSPAFSSNVPGRAPVATGGAALGPRPAVRPAGSSTAARPQIRPITARKATVVGLQPAAPAEARQPTKSVPDGAPSVRSPSGSPSRPAPDEARTVKMEAGTDLKELLSKRLGVSRGPVSRAMPAVAARGGDDTERRPLPDVDIPVEDAGLAESEVALEAMHHFRQAEAALQRNDLGQAEVFAHKAAESDPSQHDYLTLFWWLHAQNNPPATEDAVRTLSKILIEDPSNERALLYRGRLLARTNRLHEAYADFNELLSANPQHREAAHEARALKAILGA